MKDFEYPVPQGMASGCKVCWRTYAKHEDALKAADVAREAAAYWAGKGYDFGYQTPGTIVKDGNGHWRVTCP